MGIHAENCRRDYPRPHAEAEAERRVPAGSRSGRLRGRRMLLRVGDIVPAGYRK
jgi:hypothetical protein